MPTGKIASFGLTDQGIVAAGPNSWALRENWTRIREVQLAKNKFNANLPHQTDYQERYLEVLSISIQCTSRSAAKGSDIAELRKVTQFTKKIAFQAPDNDQVIKWPGADWTDEDRNGHWYVDRISIVEQGGGVAKVTLTVKSWTEWAYVV